MKLDNEIQRKDLLQMVENSTVIFSGMKLRDMTVQVQLLNQLQFTITKAEIDVPPKGENKEGENKE